MNIKRLIPKIFTIAILVFAFSSLCACGCKHVWQDATCTTPKTCTLCGATEGEALGHQWKEGRKLCLVCGLDERTVDEKFIDALAEGLNDRWAICDTIIYLRDKKEIWESPTYAEYDKISGFLDQTFENPELGKWANTYVQCIINAKELLTDWSASQWAAKYRNDIWGDRLEALYNINLIEPVPVDETYSSILNKVLEWGNVLDFNQSLMATIQFDIEDDPIEGKKLKAVAENTTSVTIKWLELRVALMDKDGVTINTKYPGVADWKPGDEHIFEFSVDDRVADYHVDSATINFSNSVDSNTALNMIY